jgi:hypothetical protein
MSVRPRADPVIGLQLSWLGDRIVAWEPSRSTAGGNLLAGVSTTLGPVGSSSVGPLSVARLHLPEGVAQVMCLQLDPASMVALARTGRLEAAGSTSITWFGAVARVADHLVRSSRVLPALTHPDDGWWQAGWRPLDGDLVTVGAALSAAVPPVVLASVPPDGRDDALREQVSRAVLTTFVDAVARLALQYSRWRPDLADPRRLEARAVRQVVRALGEGPARFRPDGDIGPELAELAAAFDDIARRAGGEPLVRARLRLGLPDGDDHWPLSFELVDADDAGRSCTIDDVVARADAALLLAGEERWLDVLADRAADALGRIGALVPRLDSWCEQPDTAVPVETAAEVLAAVDALGAAGIEVLAPQRLTRRAPRPRGIATPASRSDGDGSGRLGRGALVAWQVVVDDTPVPDEVLRRAAEAATTLVEVGGRWVRLDRADAERALEQLVRHRHDHAELDALGLLRLAAELADTGAGPTDAAPVVEAGIGSSVLLGEGWAAELLDGLPDEVLADGDVPAGFTATLRPYQLRGLGWLQFLHRLGLGGCLADDMGLGKTPTALAHLAGLPGPHLVVCPLSVVRNWQREAARFTPLLRVMVHHGPGRAGADDLVGTVAAHDIVITTYQTITRDIEALATIAWHGVVLDEAQAVKNPDTQTARAARRLPAVQRLALTGTPVENRLAELWSILSTVAPGLLGSQQQFRTRFALPIERRHDAQATATLRRLTSPFLLRRTKADRSLVPDLPDKVEQIAWAPLTREQVTMYQAVVDQLLVDAQAATGMRRRGLVLAALTRLKQICNHPAHALGDGSSLAGRSGKLTRFDELVTDLLDAGEQALVFTQFREMGLLLQRHLGERFGVRAPFLHGGVPKSTRDQMVDTFQHGGSGSPLLLVSLKAGGTGLNLTAASRVVHYDRWWNPAVEDQATDRAWRIGQQQAVFVHKLVCQGTVEERIDQLITDKRALADAVVGTTGETWLSELSTDELRELVVLDLHTARGL